MDKLQLNKLKELKEQLQQFTNQRNMIESELSRIEKEFTKSLPNDKEYDDGDIYLMLCDLPEYNKCEEKKYRLDTDISLIGREFTLLAVESGFIPSEVIEIIMRELSRLIQAVQKIEVIENE